jgi:hypothetical protein
MHEHDTQSLGIDVRRFTSFGVIKVHPSSPVCPRHSSDPATPGLPPPRSPLARPARLRAATRRLPPSLVVLHLAGARQILLAHPRAREPHAAHRVVCHPVVARRARGAYAARQNHCARPRTCGRERRARGDARREHPRAHAHPNPARAQVQRGRAVTRAAPPARPRLVRSVATIATVPTPTPAACAAFAARSRTAPVEAHQPAHPVRRTAI